MKLRCIILFALSMLLVPGAVSFAQDDEVKASELYMKTLEDLRSGDFEGAFDAIRGAEELVPDNVEYTDLAMEMRAVWGLRSFVMDGMVPGRKWEDVVETLHSFYKRYEVYDEMLTLDVSVHERLNNAFSAQMLVDTYLCLGQYKDAFQLLIELDPKSMTFENKILQGITLVHMGRKKEAVTLKKKLDIPKKPNEEQLYLLARFYVAIGYKKKAITLLNKCVELMPREDLRKLKRMIDLCKEFDAIRRMRSYKKTLKALEEALNQPQEDASDDE